VSVRSRTAGVMTTLMRNGRDRRLGKPVMGHAILERMLLVGTRSADHIRASSHSGCIAMEVTPPFENRPDTWLHPNASQNVRFLLHRGRRPYTALPNVTAISNNIFKGPEPDRPLVSRSRANAARTGNLYRNQLLIPQSLWDMDQAQLIN